MNEKEDEQRNAHDNVCDIEDLINREKLLHMQLSQQPLPAWPGSGKDVAKDEEEA